MTRTGILYLSYEGMLEPLGQSQVAAYLKELAAEFRVHLVSFEKPGDMENTAELARVTADLEAANVHWTPLRYHKRPSLAATAWDIAAGIRAGGVLIRKHRLSIVHARSYVPSVMALSLKRMFGVRYIFDMRGFWADERVDGGLWPRGGALFRTAKRFEREFLSDADHIVSLTHAGVRALEAMPNVAQSGLPAHTVIPTCADLRTFHPQSPASNKAGFQVAYVGSIGTWYNFDAVAVTMQLIRRRVPGARLLVLNKGQHDSIRETLLGAGLPEDAFEIRSVPHREVAHALAGTDLGLFYYKPSTSRAACSPTKLGEFLGCGIPCLTNSGVGDMADFIREDSVGVAVDTFNQAALEQGVTDVLQLLEEDGLALRCRESAERRFSLSAGVENYASIYRSLSR